MKATKREPVSRARVLQAAFEVVDTEGLEALSMRKVAQRLGVEAMSLYNHVDDKAALLDGLLETVLGRLPPPPTRRSATWQGVLKERAVALRTVLLAHPAFLPLFASRPAVTPGSLRQLEFVLETLGEAGFSPVVALRAFQSLFAFVVGHALSSQPTDAPSPRYDRLDAETFPRLRALARPLSSWDVDAEFRFGLECFLEGLARHARA